MEMEMGWLYCRYTMEMEMRANQDVSIGTDVTPPLPPFASSLHDSHLSSFCSSCFSPLQSTPFLPNSSFSSHRTPNSLFYCSSQCFSSDSPLHFSSAENHLLSTSHGGDTSDLRLALRLLLIFTDYPQHQHRIRGLLTNRDKLMSPENSDDEEISRRIRDGAKAMATARRMRDGEGFNVEGEDAAEEEAVLCLVLTNAVEVHVDGGQTIGLAVYDTAFSWINHSCSPSACYRFLTSVSSAWPSFSGQSRLQIIPGGGDCHIDTQIGNGVCCKTKFTKGYHASGPRIVVRSIKAIQKGDEVTVAYTDLLQPKSMRQSELWMKYRFICCCSRCSMVPPIYADCALQEILAASICSTNLSSDQNSCRDKAIEKMTDYIDDTISEFVSLEDPKSCCERLESVLNQGFVYEQSDKEGKSVSKIWLQPLHHLSLNAYTTLASAYKIRSSRLLAFHPATNTNQVEAFSMSRTGAAYSLMLAGATHHLYMSEPCLIASAAIFWSNVGESLLSLARSSVWNSFVKQRSFPSLKCCKCSLMDKFKTIFSCCLDQNAGLEDLSREFLDCITNIMPKVWSFLKCNCHYLKLVKDPIDLNWLRTMKASDMLELQAPLGATDVNSCCGEDESIFRCESLDERLNLFQLGVHCLLYGGILLNICYGRESPLTCNILDLIFGQENLIE